MPIRGGKRRLRGETQACSIQGLVNRNLTRTHTWRGIRFAPPHALTQPAHPPPLPRASLFFLIPAAPLFPAAGANGPVPLGATTHIVTFSSHPPAPLSQVQHPCPRAQIQVGHLQKPSGQAPQDHPSPSPPCSPAHEPPGPSANSCSRRWPLRPAELTPALTALGPRSRTPGAAPKPLTHAPAS